MYLVSRTKFPKLKTFPTILIDTIPRKKYYTIKMSTYIQLLYFTLCLSSSSLTASHYNYVLSIKLSEFFRSGQKAKKNQKLNYQFFMRQHNSTNTAVTKVLPTEMDETRHERIELSHYVNRISARNIS